MYIDFSSLNFLKHVLSLLLAWREYDLSLWEITNLVKKFILYQQYLLVFHFHCSNFKCDNDLHMPSNQNISPLFVFFS